MSNMKGLFFVLICIFVLHLGDASVRRLKEPRFRFQSLSLKTNCPGWLLCADGKIDGVNYKKYDLESYLSPSRRRWRNRGYITSPNKFLLHTMSPAGGECFTYESHGCMERHLPTREGGRPPVATLYRNGGIFPHFLVARVATGEIHIVQILSFDKPCLAMDKSRSSSRGTIHVEVQGGKNPPFTTNESLSKAVAKLWAALSASLPNLSRDCPVPFYANFTGESNRACNSPYPSSVRFNINGVFKPKQLGLNVPLWESYRGLVGHQHVCGRCRSASDCHAVTHTDPGEVNCQYLSNLAKLASMPPTITDQSSSVVVQNSS